VKSYAVLISDEEAMQERTERKTAWNPYPEHLRLGAVPFARGDRRFICHHQNHLLNAAGFAFCAKFSSCGDKTDENFSVVMLAASA